MFVVFLFEFFVLFVTRPFLHHAALSSRVSPVLYRNPHFVVFVTFRIAFIFDVDVYEGIVVTGFVGRRPPGSKEAATRKPMCDHPPSARTHPQLCPPSVSLPVYAR